MSLKYTYLKSIKKNANLEMSETTVCKLVRCKRHIFLKRFKTKYAIRRTL